MIAIAAGLLMALSSVNAFNGLSMGSSSCSGGASLSGYCCKGTIINPSGDLFNNGDTDLSGLICCVGDPSHAINNGPSFSSCTAGSAVPLTEAAGATAAAAGSGSTPASASATASMSVMVGTSSMAAQVTQSSGAGSSSSGSDDGESGSASSSAAVEMQSSTGAAPRMATLAPAVGGLVIGIAGLL